MRTNSFTSKYLRNEKLFRVEMKDRFGRITIARCLKRERNEMRKQFNSIRKEKVLPIEVIGSNKITENVLRKKHKKAHKKEKNLFDEILNSAYYVVDNFSANLFNEEGLQIALPYQNDFIETLVLGKFILMPKWYEKKLNLDERVSYSKIIDIDEENCLLILLPKLTFRDKRITFEFPFVVGSILTYEQAKRLHKNINKFGFQKTIISIGQIPKTNKKVNYFSTDRVIKRIANGHKRKESAKNKIMRNKVTVLKSRRRKQKYAIKSGSSKHYYSHSNNERVQNKFGGRIDAENRRKKNERILEIK